MFGARTALLVVDVQESFRHCSYWRDTDAPCLLNVCRHSSMEPGIAAFQSYRFSMLRTVERSRWNQVV